jgi:Holliday junction resolvase RusA-like endonuclease
VSTITFTVPGAPVGKGRPRVGKVGGFARLYTPEKTVNYESRVALAGHQAMAGREPVTGPVALRLDVCLPIPASWSGKKQERAVRDEIRPATKPDLDNILKAICDGLNGVAWKDDVQVVEATVSKNYSRSPRVVVLITPVEAEA